MLSYLRNVGDYMDFYQDLWNKTRDKLSNSFAEQTFNEVFGEVKKVVKVENGVIYVLVPSTFIQTKINNVYTKMIAEILASLSNQKLKFKFICETEKVMITLKVQLIVENGISNWSYFVELEEWK